MYRKHVKEMEPNTNRTGIKTLDKITDIPVVNSALTNVTDYYGQFKEKNALLRTSCNLAELSLRTIKFASTPITSLCKKPIESVDTYLCEKVDIIENNYPMITQPADQITSAAYSQARNIYEKPKETLYNTVSTTASYGGKVLESCLDSRMAKMVCDPVLDFTEKNLKYYLPTPSIYEEPEQGTVKRIYNINRRVYTHVYDATFLQLSKLHAHFEHTIQKLYALKKLMVEIYTVRKEQVIGTIKQNTLVNRCLVYLDTNNINMDRIEEISKGYYKSILADVNDIVERYMGLVKNFPAYFNATQFRATIDNLKSQMNKETFSIYLSMSIDYLKQLNESLISYTNKMIQVAGNSKVTLTNMCMQALQSNSQQKVPIQ
jgi:hypothetical protein